VPQRIVEIAIAQVVDFNTITNIWVGMKKIPCSVTIFHYLTWNDISHLCALDKHMQFVEQDNVFGY
jgi:hypothetical protein